MNRKTLSAVLLAVAGTGCDRLKRAVEPRLEHQDYFAKKCECFELATKRQSQEARADAKERIPGFVDARTEQCYVPSMNTCIYESGSEYLKTLKTQMTVDDLLTGKTLAGGPSDDPSYKRERDELFALCAK